METQVAIIGGGPAGLLLSQLLHQSGVDNIVLERQSRDYVLQRIRAGVLEMGTVEVLREAGVSDRMEKEGHWHDGAMAVWGGKRRCLWDTRKYTGKPMMAYGQTAITEDLYQARDDMGGIIIDNAKEAAIYDVNSDKPYVTFEKDGQTHRINCEYVAGCDGFHGVSRTTIPESVRTEFEKVYPLWWFGSRRETHHSPNHHSGERSNGV